ncbi:MAG: hypothetical protein IPN89_10870 [Saprospiraceae bacterium]|nr:hypothetical protein [Saprospiraceae bacterium]
MTSLHTSCAGAWINIINEIGTLHVTPPKVIDGITVMVAVPGLVAVKKQVYYLYHLPEVL